VHDPFVVAQEAASQSGQPKPKPAKKAKAASKPKPQPVAKRKPSAKPPVSSKRVRHNPTRPQTQPSSPPLPAPPPSRGRLAIDDATEPAAETASVTSPPLAPTAQRGGATSQRESKRPERLVESSADSVPQHLRDPTRKATAPGGGLRRQQSKVAQPSAGDRIYKVERILQERNGAKGVEFKIRWLDYSSDHDSWEPEAEVLDPSLIEAFRTRARGRSGSRRSASRKRKISVLVSDASSSRPLLASQRDTVCIGAEAQASIEPIVDSLQAPPRQAPLCSCRQPAAWDRGRWWCEAGTCAYECEPPPFALTPLCDCAQPCVWHHGRWWCERGNAGCDFERRETRPEPKRVCSSASRRVISSSIEGTLASSTASLLTYAAYGLEEWSFVAPTDCGLGLFARDKIQTHQVIGEYAGPRLPGKFLERTTYAFEIPDINEFVDGDGSNSPCSLIDGPANTIFANHSSSKPNAKIEVQDRKVSAFEVCEPRHRFFLVATEPIATGAEIRFDYEAGKQDGSYWEGSPPPDTLAWRNVRLPPPPPSAAEPRFSKETAPGMWADTPPDSLPSVQPLSWAGPAGGDVRLRRLVPMLFGTSTKWLTVSQWALISTHMRGRSGKECRNRWVQIRDLA